MAIYDTMQFLHCDVVTYCVGQATSISALLLSAGATGKRYILKHSRVAIHQPIGGAGGQSADIAIAAKEILRWRRTINEMLAKHTGRAMEQIEKDSDRIHYLNADEAKEYGLVDQVIDGRNKIPTPATT
jgi:ATP-dependent Clp protease, protease subunit